MPYLNARIATDQSPELAGKIALVLMKRTSELLGKQSALTSIALDFVPPDLWFIAGEQVSETKATTFFLDIKVTEGTNTKKEKATYVERVFSDFEGILGAVSPASYIVIHDLRADSWGFQGKTQEERFVHAQSL